MQLFIFILFLLFLESCTTVEVTKEIIKASTSVKTTVVEIITDEKPDSNIVKDQKIETEKENVSIEAEKESISIEQKLQQNIIETQQKMAQINFLGNSLSIIKKKLGEPIIAREDGNTLMLRYNSDECRLFLFFNLKVINKKVEYFELRDTQGSLLESKQSIEQCYREFKLIN